MAKWETEFFRGNIGETVKCEYRKLLSVNKTGEEAEALLTNYFKCLMAIRQAYAECKRASTKVGFASMG